MEFKEFKEFKGVKDNSLFASFKGVFIAKTYVFNSFYSLNSINSPSFQKLSIFYFRCKITIYFWNLQINGENYACDG